MTGKGDQHEELGQKPYEPKTNTMPLDEGDRELDR
jgi:hypothetical protein